MNTSWIGVIVRRGNKVGQIIHDANYVRRILDVQMIGGDRQTIILDNINDDPPETHEWEWLCETPEYIKWYRF